MLQMVPLLPSCGNPNHEHPDPTPTPIGVPYPPLDIRRFVHAFTPFIASDRDIEKRLLANFSRPDLISFLNASDPYHAYYQHQLSLCLNKLQSEKQTRSMIEKPKQVQVTPPPRHALPRYTDPNNAFIVPPPRHMHAGQPPQFYCSGLYSQVLLFGFISTMRRDCNGVKQHEVKELRKMQKAYAFRQLESRGNGLADPFPSNCIGHSTIQKQILACALILI